MSLPEKARVIPFLHEGQQQTAHVATPPEIPTIQLKAGRALEHLDHDLLPDLRRGPHMGSEQTHLISHTAIKIIRKIPSHGSIPLDYEIASLRHASTTGPLGEDVRWGSLPADRKTGVGEPSFYKNLRNCSLILLVHPQHMLHIKETSNDTSQLKRQA